MKRQAVDKLVAELARRTVTRISMVKKELHKTAMLHRALLFLAGGEVTNEFANTSTGRRL